MSTTDFSDPEIIAALTDALTAAGVEGLEISRPSGHLRIIVAKGGGARVTRSERRQTEAGAASTIVVKAPMAGRFCVSHPSTLTETKRLPHPVSEGDVVGFIRIGSVLLPVPAGRSGRLVRQMAEHDALVGFGDPLVEIEPQS